MYYTQEQIDRANQADLVSFLQSQGEQLTRAGNEYRWKRHDSLTVRGNKGRRTNFSDGPCRRSQGRRKGTESQEVPHGQAEKAIHPGTAGCRKKGAEQATAATGKDKRIGGVSRAKI